MARILLLTPQLPFPPYQGTTLRNLNIIRGLAARHELALFCFSSREEKSSQDAVEVLSRYCDPIITLPANPRSSRDRFRDLITSSQPDMALRLQSPQLDDTLNKLLSDEENSTRGGFDIIQVEGIEMASIIPMLRSKGLKSKIVFDSHNAETELQRRTFSGDVRSIPRWPIAAYSWIQSRRLEKFERSVCEASDYVTAVSDQDKANIFQVAPGAKISTIPNCIDTEKHLVSDSSTDSRFDIILVGKMDYRPNIDAALWFYEAIWPEIVQKRPQTTWAIVGQKPHSRLDKLRGSPGITITGWVESVSSYMQRQSIAIMPFRYGSGTRLKLLQTLAAGMAVVSTPIGAEGYNLTDQRELLIANTEHEFSEAVLRTLEDPDLRDRLGERGRSFAKRYDYRRIIPMFDSVYQELLAT